MASHPLLERIPLLQRETVCLGDNRNDIHNFAQLFHDDDIDWSKGVSSRVDEKEAAVNAGVLDVAITNGGEFLAKVGAVLILNIFHNRVPAVVLSC